MAETNPQMTGACFATLTIKDPFYTKSVNVAIPRSCSPSIDAVVPAPVLYRHFAPDWRATWVLIPASQHLRGEVDHHKLLNRLELVEYRKTVPIAFDEGVGILRRDSAVMDGVGHRSFAINFRVGFCTVEL